MHRAKRIALSLVAYICVMHHALCAMPEKLRIDKYLWAIRAFKTRSLATDACKAGRVKSDGNSIKPSHIVKPGEVYTVQKGIERRVIRVTGLLERRVDAKTAVTFYEDITPVEETHAFKSVFHRPLLNRDRGTGRPTKKERRDIDDLLDDKSNQDSWFDDDES
jgi:ribosome-associated heat shock protein Hsp15